MVIINDSYVQHNSSASIQELEDTLVFYFQAFKALAALERMKKVAARMGIFMIDAPIGLSFFIVRKKEVLIDLWFYFIQIFKHLIRQLLPKGYEIIKNKLR